MKLGQHALDFLEDSLILHNTHAEKFIRSPVLVENIVGVLAELLHVRPDKHLPELDEVTVVLVVDLDYTPWVCTTAHFATIRRLYQAVGADNGEWNLACDFFSFGKGFLILVLVCRRLEDMDVVVRNVSQDLLEVDFQL